tara:strand:- start:2635 stop:3840 length:1206 start_codon:yes stop_codon:yes gene_type:complete
MIRVLSLLFLLSVAPTFAADAPRVKLQPVYQNLEIERPISIQIPDDGTNRRFLVEQTGKIRLLPEDESSAEAKIFFDFTDMMGVAKDFEEGLLGLAFHPDFKSNGRFYLSFSRQGPKRLCLAEYTVSSEDPDRADPDSERVLLEVQQPDWNHNSGNLFFGPKDGLLYLCVGDGGLKNGVFLLAQNLGRWNGKVLRIDVDSRTNGLEYGIPSDNPYIDDPIACPEIWAWGLRNPWGAAIDPENGLFYLADVGQDLWEEINLIEKGGNYGWDYREASHRFATRDAFMTLIGRKTEEPKSLKFVEPIFEYGRAEGLSITGGYVYRGEAIPALKGHFLYGDWRFGHIWALYYDPASGSVTANHVIEKTADLKNPTVQPAGFYPDENGEPLVLGWKGSIFRIVAGE